MKTKVALIVLIVVTVGLGIGLITVNKQAEDQHTADATKISNLSNQWSQAEQTIEKQSQELLVWDQKEKAAKADMAKLSNDLAQATENLGKSEAALKSANEEAAKRDAKIADLENQNEALDKQTADLKGSIGKLEVAIADTQKKLSASEGDKAFLEKELQRLVAEKRELERQFNDLAVLKDQVHKLKEELSVKRRVEWMRMGIFAMGEQKGAQRLMQGANAVQLKPAGTNNYDLNVEVKSDGSLQVIPPLTNPPSAPSTPDKQ